ncbi:transporter [Hymenobacter sp. BT175]|uniref:transporter n=1 Tax=Hymenobacter translucens TaxID=2886507 RepID=UPI001D0E193D|nr:transporter [Hymenobacter translucens]MCC2545282.1 transporter [Hymenobacter translucens]
MQKTILLALATLTCATTRTLAQDAADNQNAPFVRNIRPDRPGMTITTNMLRPGQVQLDAGVNRVDALVEGGARRTLSSATLRVGFFNHIELRATQNYLQRLPALAPETGGNTRQQPSGLAPLTVGAKFLASTNQDAKSQVVMLAEMTLRNGDSSFVNKVLEPAARVLISQQIGERYGLEANLGFRQRGFKAADTKVGTYLTTVALNGPISANTGFFAEAYSTFQRDQGARPGVTTGLYWRPIPGIRFDVTAGQGMGKNGTGFTAGAGLSLRLGGNK